ncbi:paired box protein 6 homolog [Lytechinus pictus]|uniref:paired box protein 6 homolog n=1 Tax=Lytechinus pictus TaxID=7653 RepID=UPI0030BA001C
MPGPTATAARERVVALRQEGYKQTDIAEVLGISQSAVSKILKRQREAGNVRPRKSPGRPRLTTRRDDRQLLNFSRRNRKLSTSVFVACGGDILGSTFPGQSLIADCSNMVTEHDG